MFEHVPGFQVCPEVSVLKCTTHLGVGVRSHSKPIHPSVWGPYLVLVAVVVGAPENTTAFQLKTSKDFSGPPLLP